MEDLMVCLKARKWGGGIPLCLAERSPLEISGLVTSTEFFEVDREPTTPVRLRKSLTHGTGHKAPGFPLLSHFVPRWEEICVCLFLAFFSPPKITGRKQPLRWHSLYTMVLNITLVWTRAHHLEKNISS